MAIQGYPGVYIEEFEPAAPIQGVGTSLAAFVALNAFGTPMQPTLLTSWEEYLQKFGPPPGTAPEDDDFLYYAVRGFFANGGTTCFVIAVSNAKADFADLQDSNGTAAMTIAARRLGRLTPQITVTTAATTTPVSGLNFFVPEADIATAAQDDTSVVVDDAVKAARFLAGDQVRIGTNALSEPATVARTDGRRVYLNDRLRNPYTNATLQLAPLAPFERTFRVVDAAAGNANGAATLVPGSIIRVTQGTGPGAVTPQRTVVTAVRPERMSATETTYRVTVRDGLNGFTLYAADPIQLRSQEFDLTVTQGTATPPPYTGLSMEPLHPRYFVNVINSDPEGLIAANPSVPPNMNFPVATQALQGGTSHSASIIKGRSIDYEDALKLLEPLGDVNLIVVPDRTDIAVQGAVTTQCTRLYDRFAILDAAKGSDRQAVQNQRAALDEAKGFSALYHPWIEVASVKTGQRISVPPSGHIAGIYARTDLTRGVFKAPAGNDCTVSGALAVDQVLSNNDQAVLNLKGINIIRVFQRNGRPIVWGARTTSSNTNWQYVNIRRLFIFLEQSIQIGIRGSVFEPNNPTLWKRLKRTITAFLTQQWRDGALFGAKVEEAFYVRIDETINPDNERALGRLYIEIGIRPSYPAEFIVVRIGIWQGGSDVTES